MMCPDRRNLAVDHRAGSYPVTLDDMERGRGLIAETDGVRMMRRFGETDDLGLGADRLRESAEVGEAADEPVAVID